MSPKAPSMSSNDSCSSSRRRRRSSNTETDRDSLFSSSSSSGSDEGRNISPPHVGIRMPASRRRRRPANSRGTDSDEEGPIVEDDAGQPMVNEEKNEAAAAEKSDKERSGFAPECDDEKQQADQEEENDDDDTETSPQQKKGDRCGIPNTAAGNEKAKEPQEERPSAAEDAEVHHEEPSQQDEHIVAQYDAETSPQQEPSRIFPSSDTPTPHPLPQTTKVGMVEFDVEAIRAQILCRLCQGLYREPYTTIKCRHTFCKSCLATALHSSTFSTSEAFNACPQCQLYLGRQADTASVALPDRTLESLIDKVLFPALAQADREAEWAMYRNLGIERKELPGEILLQQQQQQQLVRMDADESHAGSSRKRTRSDASSEVWEEGEAVCTTTVLFQLVPGSINSEDDVQETHTLKLPFLQTEGSVRVEQLKRYINQKLDLHDSGGGGKTGMDVVMRCCSVVLTDKMTVAQIEDSIWEKTSTQTMMQLSYTLGSIDKA